jgi:flavin reductase (DIM6/NTAB) family NADH-FMN oxidoreductase RutF
MVDAKEFRTALSRYASGVTVVTARDGAGVAHGITVSAFSSLSLDPPQILICLARTAAAHQAILDTGAFVVNVLSDAQENLSRQFASKLPDRFHDVPHHPGDGNIPLLDGALAHYQCKLAARHDGGDHSIFVGSLEKFAVTDGRPLLYFQGSYGDLHSRPAVAPPNKPVT